MPPLLAALIAAGLTVFFFVVFHQKVAKPWLRNILIILATALCLFVGGTLAGSNEKAVLTGQIYFVVIVIVYLISRAGLFGGPVKKPLWTILGVAFLGIVAFVDHKMDEKRDAETILAIGRGMGDRIKQVDMDYAREIKAAGMEAAMAVLGSERIADPAARRTALASFGASLKITDEAIARRERVPEEIINEIRAMNADSRLKERAIAGVRSAMAGAPPASLQMMKGMRVFLAKAEEVVAHVERQGAGVAIRDGRLAFADSSGAETYNALQSQLVALHEELRRLKP